MKTVSAGFNSRLRQSDLSLVDHTLVQCWKIKRTDGVVLAFTEHDRDLSFDLGDGDGTLTYKAKPGFTRENVRTSGDFRVDNLEALGVIDDTDLKASDFRAGRYDFAEVKIFALFWDDLSLNEIKLRRGHVGGVTLKDIAAQGELRGLLDVWNTTEVVENSTPGCRADLGDSRCKVQMDPQAWAAGIDAVVRTSRDAVAPDDSGSPSPVNTVKPTTFNDRWFECSTAGQTGTSEPSWNLTIDGTTNDGSAVWTTIQARVVTATVASVVSNREFTIDYTGDASETLLTGGLVTVLDTVSPTPANAGLKREIKQYAVSPPTVITYLPFPFDLEVGDPVELRAGCAKTVAACRDLFDNIHNMRAEPHKPLNDQVLRTPDAR